MFDLITGKVQHAPRHQAVSVLVSSAAQVAIVAAIVTTTVLVIDPPIPKAAMMMAFVAAPPPPPPPPPPKAPEPAPSAPKPVPTTGAAAPVEPPVSIEPERPPTDLDDEGVVDVAGGVPGGIIGGVVGDLEPLPPPPPPPASRRPVRVGGVIKEPALTYRVEPVYPGVAISANIEGTVILEAIVNEDGRVETVRVLRSVSVLDRAAVDAVKQWRYSPVILNGIPEKFILTVAVTFRLEGLKK
jgi:protein TonB